MRRAKKMDPALAKAIATPIEGVPTGAEIQRMAAAQTIEAVRKDIEASGAVASEFYGDTVPAAAVNATLSAMQGDIDRLRAERDAAISRAERAEAKVAYQRQSIRDLEAKLRANGLA